MGLLVGDLSQAFAASAKALGEAKGAFIATRFDSLEPDKLKGIRQILPTSPHLG